MVDSARKTLPEESPDLPWSRGPVDPSAVDPVVEIERGDLSLIDRYAVEWAALAGTEPFQRPEWTRRYLEAFAPEATLVLLTARVDERLAAVLPLVEERRRIRGLPATVLRSASNVHSCRFELIHAPGAEGSLAGAALWQRLLEERTWTALELVDVPVGGELSRLAAEASPGLPLATEVSIASPWFELPPGDEDLEEWLAERLPGKFRRELRRRARQLDELGRITLRHVGTADRDSLAQFYALEAAGWKGDNGTAIASDPSTHAFYDALAADVAGAGMLDLYFLDLNGEPIAAHLGIGHAGRYFTVKVAYAEEHGKLAPGHQIIAAVLPELQRRGFSEFDFLGPTMDWKMQWADRVRPLHTLHLYRRSPVGHLLHLVQFGWKGPARRIAALAASLRPARRKD